MFDFRFIPLALSILVLVPGIDLIAAMKVQPEAVSSLCRHPYQCGSETPAPDNRPLLAVKQPSDSQEVKGNCSTLPSDQNYMATIGSLQCGSNSVTETRRPIEHPQEKLDSYWSLWNAPNRRAAQEVLLTTQGWTEKLPIQLRENWVYMKKKGGYIEDCSRRYMSEGGGKEPYRTTCYRPNRKEKVFKYVIRRTRTCRRFNEPPPEREDSSPAISGGTFTPSTPRAGGSQSSGSSRPEPQSPTAPQSTDRSTKKAEKNRGGDTSGRARAGKNAWKKYKYWSAIDYGGMGRDLASFNEDSSLRHSSGRDEYDDHDGPAGPDGCAEWGEYKEQDRRRVEFDEDVEDIAYDCTVQVNKWCTWFETEPASQICPDTKTITVDVSYVTPPDWNPSNTDYDDQLPNKFDLLLGEAEFVRISLNDNRSLETSITPTLEFKNALPNRTLNWNEYKATANPSALSCRYADQSIKIEVSAEHRIEQAAPNPLIIPKDENGNYLAFQDVDTKGRPANLILINPGRNQVLDRSNMSRIFGKDDPRHITESEGDKDSSPSKKAKGGIHKFWENTRFRMRLVWYDGKKRVKVTQAREFDINKATPIGDELSISLTGEMGMQPFYRLAVPFEKWFGFLGTDVSLDPQKKYFVEIKVAQTGFEGIYESGLNLDDLDEEEKNLPMEVLAVRNKAAYSEPLQIPLPVQQSKLSPLEMFFQWQSRRMWRP